MAGRETGLRKLMNANLLKRLESSVWSFRMTLERILGYMTATLEVINAYKANRNQRVVVEDASSQFDFDLDDEEDREDSMMLAQAILDALKVKPEDYDVDETRDWWPYKDWADLKKRVGDVGDTDVELGDEANEYIEWQPGDTSVFKMKISCESMGMTREVNCKCYVKDKKVRYIEWRED